MWERLGVRRAREIGAALAAVLLAHGFLSIELVLANCSARSYARRVRRLTASLVVLVLLVSAAASEAKRQAATDRRTHVRFLIDGAQLTLTLLPRASADTRERLVGQPLTLVCTTAYRYLPWTRLIQEFAWPDGQTEAVVTLPRDVSSEVKACLIEGDPGPDIADVGFGPPPGRLLVQTSYESRDAAPSEGSIAYLRLRDTRGRLVLRRQGSRFDRLLEPGRYTLRRFERVCAGTCDRLGAPTLRCKLRFRVRPADFLAVSFAVNYSTHRCETFAVRNPR